VRCQVSGVGRRKGMSKIGIYQEREPGVNTTYFCIYKNGKDVKLKLSAMSVEDLRELSRMVDGMAHKLWHILHYKLFKCCPTCHVKKRKK